MVTEMVTVPIFPAEIGSDLGLKAHEVPGGNPEH